MARTRLIDIANAAGVSLTTASYVMNHRPVAIPMETRQRIFWVARELNYRPNQMARNLAQRTSGLIGVISPLNGSPFHARLVAELCEHAAERSYKLVFESVAQDHGGAAGYQNAIDRLLQWRVDGLLLWSESPIRDVRVDCPLVSMGPFALEEPGCGHVTIDLYRSAQLATRHLIDLGHTDLCFVGHPEHEADLRWTAVCDELGGAGLPNPARLGGHAEALNPREAVMRLVQGRDFPTAFVAISDVQALEVFRALRNRRLRVPEDVSLVSCDETWAAENLDPPLTAVSIPFQASTKQALDRLLGHIRGDEAPMGDVPAPTLAVRGSTAAPRASLSL